jgi:hypothetical protein
MVNGNGYQLHDDIVIAIAARLDVVADDGRRGISSEPVGPEQPEVRLSPLATLPTILSLCVAHTEAGRIQADRACPLTGIVPNRTTGKAGICWRIS